MSSNGEFSTMSSEEMPSLPKSLPSSREATAEGGSGSSGGYMPLREFLDRFSLPRVVRLEGTGGRPVLLYKQQQRSLRVTASLLMHRYRHDVKVGPEIVIPEGYPGEALSLGRPFRAKLLQCARIWAALGKLRPQSGRYCSSRRISPESGISARTIISRVHDPINS